MHRDPLVLIVVVAIALLLIMRKHALISIGNSRTVYLDPGRPAPVGPPGSAVDGGPPTQSTSTVESRFDERAPYDADSRGSHYWQQQERLRRN